MQLEIDKNIYLYNTKFIITGSFFILFLFQFIFLDSDPSPLIRWGTISDEGFWQHNARMKILFGNFMNDQFNIALLGAPFYNILVFLSYKIFGISIFSARLVSLISLWVILIILYNIIRNDIGKKKALASILIFGSMHELIMYTKWATPVMLEALCITAILYFYINAIKGHKKKYYLLTGIFLALAILAKLTSILFLLPMLLFLGIEYKKNIIKWDGIKNIIIGFIIIIIPMIVFYFIPNFHEYKIMFQNYGIGYEPVSFFQQIISLVTFPLQYNIMKHPSSVILFIIFTLYAFELILKLINIGYNRTLIHLTSIECFTILWILGLSVLLAITGQLGAPRREIQLFIPFFLLSIYYVINLNKIKNNFNKLKSVIRLPLFIVMTIIISFYLSSIYYMSVMKWFQNYHFNEIIENLFRIRYFIPIGFIISLLFYLNKTPLLINIFIPTMVVISMVLNSTWYLNPTYTLKEVSKDLSKYSKGRSFLLGKHNFWHVMDNYLYPLYHTEKINLGISQLIKNKYHLHLSSLNQNLGNEYNRRITLQEKYYLSPYPFTESFRDSIVLYTINESN